MFSRFSSLLAYPTDDTPAAGPDQDQQQLFLHVPDDRSRSFYLTFIDPSNRFQYIVLEHGKTYTPSEGDRHLEKLISVPAAWPAYPWITRGILYWKWLPRLV